MSNPASVLFQQPTQFMRSLRSMNSGSAWDGDISNNTEPFPAGGIGNPFSDAIPGLGGTSGYDAARRPDLGAYEFLTFKLPLDQEEWAQHRVSDKQLTFVSRNASNPLSVDARGISSMNALAVSQHGIATYATEPDLKKLKEDWNFYGVPTTRVAADLRMFSERVQGFRIQKAAKIINYIAINQSDHVSIGDHIYIIMRRVKTKDTLASMLPSLPRPPRSGAVAPMSTPPPTAPPSPYRASFDVWITKEKVPPPAILYSNAMGRGRPYYVGTAMSSYGAAELSSRLVSDLRQMLHPTRDNEEYLETMKCGSEIDIQLALWV